MQPQSLPAGAGPLVPRNSEDWHVVLRSYRGIIVRYNRGQRALTVETNNSLGLIGPRRAGQAPIAAAPAAQSSDHSRHDVLCPFCKRPLHEEAGSSNSTPSSSSSGGLDHTYNVPRLEDAETAGHLSTDYFHLLSEAHQTSANFATPEPSRPGTPAFAEVNINASLEDSAFSEGYYQRFFNEITLLGRGMSGSVYLCQHVLNGNPIGLFACKKIPVGNNSRSLVKALREITHLESLRHPNIVAIHHVWLETASPGLGPPVPCLFALMDYAHDGSLDRYIRSRGGLREAGVDSGNDAESLKQKFRMRRQSKGASSRGNVRPIHLLNQEEILSLFSDIVSGLAFLHEHNMLHLDIKAENILLHRADGDVSFMPTAMLSDFGSAEARNAMNRNQRSGTTGTLDYLAPEAFELAPDGRPRQHTAALDLWALGLVLHLLVFFRLPYENCEDIDALTEEIKAYRGFDRRTTPHIRHDLPNAFFDLLESLINTNPFERPSASYVKEVVQQLRGQSSPRPRARKPPHSPKYDEVSSKTLIPRQSSPPRFPKKLPSPVAPAVALAPTSRQWNLTVFEIGRGRSSELQTIGLLAARAYLGLLLASVSERSTIGRTGSLPISTLVLLISISAVEVVNNVSLAAACLTTSVLACLAYLVPQSVFLG